MNRGGILLVLVLIVGLASSTIVYAEETGFWGGVKTVLESVFNVGNEETPRLAPGSTNIYFITPTPEDNFISANNFAEIKTEINDVGVKEINYNWDGVNYNVLNSSKMILYYNFDNISAIGDTRTVVTDVSGNGRNGIANNPGTNVSITNANCKSKSCFFSNGINSPNEMIKFVNTTYGRNLNMATNPISIVGWFYPAGSPLSNIMHTNSIFGTNAGTNQKLDLTIIWSNLRVGIQDSSYAVAPIGEDYVWSQKWTFFAVVMNGTTVKLYIDGDYKSYKPYTSFNLASNIYIGATAIPQGGYDSVGQWNGSIDEFAIYNRSLSSSEIKQMYFTTLSKFDVNKWTLYVNQNDLLNKIYVYNVSEINSSGRQSSTEQRNLYVGSATCDNDGTCELGETCVSCIADCEGKQADCGLDQLCSRYDDSGSGLENPTCLALCDQGPTVTAVCFAHECPEPPYIDLGMQAAEYCLRLVPSLGACCQIPDSSCIDGDGDGYNLTGGDCGPVDCNDGNISIYQNLIGYPDADIDTYYSMISTQVCSGASLPAGYRSTIGNDCVDTNNAIHPGAIESARCDGIDQNCDGVDYCPDCTRINSSFPVSNICLCPGTTSEEICSPGNYCCVSGGLIGDCQNDLCEMPEICSDGDGDGYGTNCALGTDCNDGNIAIWQNLIGYPDADIDTYYSMISTQVCSGASLPAGYSSTIGNDCNDNSFNIKPGALEICDTLDNDCDGFTDEGVLLTFYRDADVDGYGNSSLSTQACSVPSGYVSNNNDCNDNNFNVKPGATETCNNVDDNCDTLIDNGVAPNACGTGVCLGTQTCSAGTWGTCSTSGIDAGICASCNASGNIIYNPAQSLIDCPTSCDSLDNLSTSSCSALYSCSHSITDCNTLNMVPECSGVGTSSLIVSTNNYDCVTNSCSLIGDSASASICDGLNQCSAPINRCSTNYYCYYESGFKWGTSRPSSELSCTDGYDNDCLNDGVDYGASLVAHGDSDCPVSVSAISVSNNNPIENTNINVQCTANANGLAAVKARIGTVDCSFVNWLSNVATFSCNVGTFGTKNVECYVDTGISYQSGTNKISFIDVRASQCSAYSLQSTCDGDSACDWCVSCNGATSSGLLTDTCVNSGSCMYTCSAEQCGAECSFGATDVTTRCSVDNTQVLQDTNNCQASTCVWDSLISTIPIDTCTVDEICIIISNNAQCVAKGNDIYTVNLTQGWNFVSVPLRNITDNSISQFGDRVLTYNSTNNMWLVNYKGSNQISTIEPARGYIVWADSSRQVQFTGRLDPTISYPLNANNWNLIGVTRNAQVGTIYGGLYSVYEGGNFVDIGSVNLTLGKSYWVHSGIGYAPPKLPGFGNFLGYLFERSKKEVFG